MLSVQSAQVTSLLVLLFVSKGVHPDVVRRFTSLPGFGVAIILTWTPQICLRRLSRTQLCTRDLVWFAPLCHVQQRVPLAQMEVNGPRTPQSPHCRPWSVLAALPARLGHVLGAERQATRQATRLRQRANEGYEAAVRWGLLGLQLIHRSWSAACPWRAIAFSQGCQKFALDAVRFYQHCSVECAALHKQMGAWAAATQSSAKHCQQGIQSSTIALSHAPSSWITGQQQRQA